MDVSDCAPGDRVWVAFTHAHDARASVYAADVVLPSEKLLRDTRFNNVFVVECWQGVFATEREARAWAATRLVEEGDRYREAAATLLAERQEVV